ncbi:hypothetical protein BGW42_000428 [Actinomortierella wolfii]|nr:hypothetical protein BGW42_000428 [Actinomortierella wolfii]
MREKSDSDKDNHSHSSSIVETEGQENDKDMFGPQHWVEAEQLFMQRLGDLIHLRELDLGTEDCKDIPTKDHTCLTWSLANGLDHLRGLSKLQWLVRGRGRFLQDVKDLEWMKRHWPNLREMTCVPLDDGTQQWFKEHMPSLKIIMLSPRRPSYVFTSDDLSEEDSYQGEEGSYQSEDDIDMSEENIDLSEEDSDMSEEDSDMSEEDSDQSEEDSDY